MVGQILYSIKKWALSRHSSIIWATGICTTLAIFILINATYLERNRLLFQHDAIQASALLRQELLSLVDVLLGYADHLAVIDAVDCRSGTYARSILARHSSLRGLSSNALVSDKDRDTFETLHRVMQQNFQITELVQEGIVAPAKRRSQYAVVTCIEPLQGNEKAIGFDLLSEPTRKRAIETAIATGLPSATSRINLVQDNRETAGVLIVTTVRQPETQNIIGLASAVISFPNVFERTFSNLPKGWSLRLHDNTGSSDDELFSIGEFIQVDTGAIVSQRFNIAERLWTLRIQLGWNELAWRTVRESWSWLWLLAGFLLTWATAQIITQTQQEARNLVTQANLAERRRILSDMHDSIGASLAVLISHLNPAGGDWGQLKRKATQILTELRLLVDSVGGQDTDINAVLASVRHRMQSGLELASIKVIWRVDQLPKVMSLSPPDALSLRLIIMEALSNILHHSGANTVTVSATFDKAVRLVMIKIADDGSGFATTSPNDGAGLKNMQARANKLTWPTTVHIESAPGKGTTVELKIELPPDIIITD